MKKIKFCSTLKTRIFQIFGIFILFFAISCEKANKSFFVDTRIDISYTDMQNADLLNPQTPNSFTNVIVFNKVNGKTENGSFSVDKDTSNGTENYYLNLNCSTDTTLIKLIKPTEIITDTVICEFEKKPGFWVIKKAWYNGILRWEYSNETPCGFVIKR